jgi:hypothetical protein
MISLSDIILFVEKKKRKNPKEYHRGLTVVVLGGYFVN